MRLAWASTFTAALLALGAAGCGGGDDDEPASERGRPPVAAGPRFVPARRPARVEHALVPLTSVRLKVFEGSERDPDTGQRVKTRVVSRVLDRTRPIAGVRSAVVEVHEYEDGELVEHTFDYYAQAADGGVWYMGEDVEDIEDGKVVGHGGEWLAGKRGARPGLFMPARPKAGDVFEQERAPGVAEDRSTVLATGRTVRTPAGTFDDCIRTRDVAPLNGTTEFKHYCAGVGLVSEGGGTRLVRYR